jgi:hypothetical protein
MAAFEVTAHRSAAILGRTLRALIASTLLGCATGASDPDSQAGGREGQRTLLAKTTPNAAAAAAPPPGGDPASGNLPPTDGETRPGRLLIYSAITGHVPLEERNINDPDPRSMSPTEREAARSRQIELEIQEELAKQESITGTESASTPPDPHLLAPRLAPAPAPTLRKLPTKLFESREVTIPPGQWQNAHELRVMRRSLDVDRDGKPEEVRYIDADSGLILRSELDRDFDGTLDAWITYENGTPAIQVLDENGDGTRDTWERYRDGSLLAKTTDSDADGVKDVFYRYDGTELVQKLSDQNNDAAIDRIETFAGRHRKSIEEDRSMSGQMDTWTTYRVIDGREVITQIERDSRDRGTPNIVEIYETQGDSTRLARKEEDLDGDGNVDIVSTYEDGRLLQRAISDEALSPL